MFPRLPDLCRPLLRFDTAKMEVIDTDVLVVGSGVAGLRAAIEAARYGRVILATKRELHDGNTFLAQGGIAASLGPGDSVACHVRDTLKAGQGLCDPAMVRLILEEGPRRVRELIAWGLPFDRRRGSIDLAMEGGHSRPRILHAGGDATGAELERTLLRRIARIPNLRVMEHTFLVDLLIHEDACVGALVHNDPLGVRAVHAGSVILATGGIGQLYRETTNPEPATGDGLAAAFRAGAALQDLEFVQFHPTAFYVAGASRALISETVRGAGAILRDRHGKRFMPEYHPAAELAPRDAVSRAIVTHLARHGGAAVFLDVTHLPAEKIRKRFPNLRDLCASFGIDIARELIPVRPAAHYMVGGVRTDALGRTTVRRLYCCGEAAATGLHGANRLGSNSLLEGLVMGRRAGEHAGRSIPRRPARLPRIVARRAPRSGAPIDLLDARNSLRSLMWRQAGLLRDAAGLREAIERIDFWCGYILAREFDAPAAWELQNMLLLGRLVATAALARAESRGVHYRSDFPAPDDRRWKVHVLLRGRLLRAVPGGRG